MQQLGDLWTYFAALRAADVLDIFLVAAVIFVFLYAVRGTRAVQLLRGVLLIVLVVLMFRQFVQLTAFSWLVGVLVLPLLISVPVIFQPELRRALERLGRAGLVINRPHDGSAADSVAGMVVLAAGRMAQVRCGALIVIERETGLDDLADRGVRLDAVATSDLLVQIFYPKSPLHDGAVILRHGRVVAARVVLPLSETVVEEGLGTRHLAAASVTESTDAVAVIVSEQTGTMSIARNGEVRACVDEAQLLRRLQRALASPGEMAQQRFWRPLQRAAGEGAGALLASPARVIRRAWLDHLSSALLSLVLALMVWLISNGDAHPVESVSPFPRQAEIPIMFADLPDGRAVFDPSARGVTLGLRGIKGSMETLQAGDFEASVDLSHAPPDAASYSARVRVACRVSCARRGVRVVSVSPVSVTVHLGPLVTTTMAVELDRMANVPSSDISLEAQFTPPVVTLRGAAVSIAKVARVLVKVPAMQDPLEVNAFGPVDVLPIDAIGRPVYEVEARPNAVAGVLRFQRPVAELSVSVDIHGKPPEGFVLNGWEVKPPWVQLDGPREALQKLSVVSTQSVDVSGFTEDRSVQVGLKLPKDVVAVNAPEGVTVTVRIVAPGSMTFDVPVLARNVPPDLIATVTPGQVRVLLGGTQSDLEKLDAGAVKAFVDVAGRERGRWRVPVQIEPPSGARLLSQTPLEVDVLLEPSKTPVAPALLQATPSRVP